jgi:hypothetical protein
MIMKGAVSNSPETKVHQTKLISHCPQPDTHKVPLIAGASTIAAYSGNIKPEQADDLLSHTYDS